MYFDRFDILSAYYLFGRDYHSGQGSKEYAYMGRAENAGFRPGASFGVSSLTDNGREIYDALVSKDDHTVEVWGKDLPDRCPCCGFRNCIET